MFFLPFLLLFLLQLSLYVIAQSQDSCLLTGNGNGLPPLPDRGYPEATPRSRIHHRHQAIIPSYRLNCCGNITEWGVDLNPGGTPARFNFIFQVWRPASNVNVSGCYSLVDDFISSSIPIGIQPTPTINVARITPLPADQLQFQPGDVLGFYVESHGDGSNPDGDADNGVALLTSGSYTSEVVWYGSIGDGTAQVSHTVPCPYPIGATGVLRSSTHAAPAISISIMTHSCHQSSSTTIASSVLENIHVSSAYTISSIPTVVKVPGHHVGLISGVVTASVIICISTITITTIIAIAIAKRRRKFSIATSSNEAHGVHVTSPTIRVQTNVAYVVNKPLSEESEAEYVQCYSVVS